MASLTVQPNVWTELYGATDSGSFRVVNFSAKVLQASSAPTGSEGLTITLEDGPSGVFTFSGDGINGLYILNMSDRAGSVERDR
jgi:hypothetical protein